MYTPICGDHVIIHDEFIGYDFTTGGIINRTQYMPYELLYELGLHGFTIGLPVKFTPLYLMASTVPGLMGWSKWVWWVAYGGITLKGLLLSKHLVRGAEVSAQPASIWPSCCQTYLLYLYFTFIQMCTVRIWIWRLGMVGVKPRPHEWAESAGFSLVGGSCKGQSQAGYQKGDGWWWMVMDASASSPSQMTFDSLGIFCH